MRRVEQYVAEIDVAKLASFGYGRYELPDEGIKAKIALKWLGDPWAGIACNLDSPGHKALDAAIAKVKGSSSSFSLTGSLPLVGDLQQEGFDVQITGFGRMEVRLTLYHLFML